MPDFSDSWRRVQEAVRDREKTLRSPGYVPEARVHPGDLIVHVKITGERVAMTTTSSTTDSSTPPVLGTSTITATGTTSSTSTTTTTTTTSGTGTTSSTTSTTSPSEIYCYPGTILVRDLRVITSDDDWFDTGDQCWVQELNDADLIVGNRYKGNSVEWYNGLPLVIVEGPSGSRGGGMRTVRVTGYSAEWLRTSPPQFSYQGKFVSHPTGGTGADWDWTDDTTDSPLTIIQKNNLPLEIDGSGVYAAYQDASGIWITPEAPC